MPCSDCSPNFAALPKLNEFNPLSRLRFNQLLDLSEVIELKAIVSHAEKELSDYSTAIARLHDPEMIIALEDERESLRRQVHLTQALLAPTPIQKLPPEILSEIFMECGDCQRPRVSVSSKTCFVPALKFASVCSYWRSVAVETAALWNDIRVIVMENYDSRHDLLIEKLLQFSGNSSLTIDILVNSSYTDRNTPVPSVLRMLCEHANRWQSLSGSCDYGAVDILNTLSSIGRLDCLHTYILDAPLDTSIALVGRAPKLQTLTLRCLDGSSLENYTAITWDHITHFTVSSSSISDIVRSIAKMPILLSLKVWYPLAQDSTHNENPVRSVNAHSLGLHIGAEYEEQGMTQLLELLTFPKLQSLSISCESRYARKREGAVWSSNQLPSFIERSSAIITSFDLRNTWMGTDSLIALLRSMPALTSLNVLEPPTQSGSTRSSMLNDQFLSILHCHEDRPLLQRLTTLTLRGVWSSAFSIKLFVEVIHSRWRPTPLQFLNDTVACIRTVNLEIVDSLIAPNSVKLLVMLQGEGLDISIKDQNGVVAINAAKETII